MSRALWEALGEAVDACEAANDEYAHAPTFVRSAYERVSKSKVITASYPGS